MYIIHLNHLEGAELILKSLREVAQAKGCVARADLADGIEASLYVLTPDGELKRVVPEDAVVPDRPKLTVVKGSGSMQ